MDTLIGITTLRGPVYKKEAARLSLEKMDKKQVLGILRYHLLPLTLCGAASAYFFKVDWWYFGVLGLLLVVFLDLIEKLSSIGQPKVTIISMLKDTKDAFSNMTKEVSTRLKK